MLWSRRALVRTALLAVAARPARWLVADWAGFMGRGGAAATARALTACFRDPASPRAVGRAYLAAVPEEASVQGLVRRLIGEASAVSAPLPLTDRDALRAAMRSRIRRDFAEGRIVMVDGWFLSQTEARLCALTACG